MNTVLVNNLDAVCEFTNEGIYYTNVRLEKFFHPYGSINKIYISVGNIVVESKESMYNFHFPYNGKQKKDAKEAVVFANQAIKTAASAKVKKIKIKNIERVEQQMKINNNVSEKTNTNEKDTIIALILFVLLSAIAFFITEKLIASVIISAVFTGGLCVCFNGIIKSKNSANKKEFYIKVVVWSIVLFILWSIFNAFITNNEPSKCINCGKNAMYTKSGWCYSCYKDAENAVIDAYDKY